MGPFRTQQALLAFDDNVLEGHTAEEADMGGEEGHPPPGPLRIAQHCPLTALTTRAQKSPPANFLPSAQPLPCWPALPCPVPPLPFAQEDLLTGVSGASAPGCCPVFANPHWATGFLEGSNAGVPTAPKRP